MKKFTVVLALLVVFSFSSNAQMMMGDKEEAVIMEKVICLDCDKQLAITETVESKELFLTELKADQPIEERFVGEVVLVEKVDNGGKKGKPGKKHKHGDDVDAVEL